MNFGRQAGTERPGRARGNILVKCHRPRERSPLIDVSHPALIEKRWRIDCFRSVLAVPIGADGARPNVTVLVARTADDVTLKPSTLRGMHRRIHPQPRTRVVDASHDRDATGSHRQHGSTHAGRAIRAHGPQSRVRQPCSLNADTARHCASSATLVSSGVAAACSPPAQEPWRLHIDAALHTAGASTSLGAASAPSCSSPCTAPAPSACADAASSSVPPRVRPRSRPSENFALRFR